jgi:membrane protease YdiL (CAAX protease family)
MSVKNSAQVLNEALLCFFVACITAILLTPFACEGIILVFQKLLYPFARVFDRVFLIALMLALFMRRKTFFQSKMSLLMYKTSDYKKALFCFLLATITGTLYFFLLYKEGVLTWFPRDSFYLFRKGILLLPTAMLIASIEEFIFRMLFLTILIKRFNIIFAFVAVNLVYATVHFIQPVKTFRYESYDFLAGFSYFKILIVNAYPPSIIWGIIGLFIIGVALSIMYFRSKVLLLSITYHAGLIVSVKISTFIFVVSNTAISSSGLGTRYYMLADWRLWALVLLNALCIDFVITNKKTSSLICDEKL